MNAPSGCTFELVASRTDHIRCTPAASAQQTDNPTSWRRSDKPAYARKMPSFMQGNRPRKPVIIIFQPLPNHLRCRSNRTTTTTSARPRCVCKKKALPKSSLHHGHSVNNPARLLFTLSSTQSSCSLSIVVRCTPNVAQSENLASTYTPSASTLPASLRSFSSLFAKILKLEPIITANPPDDAHLFPPPF